MAAPEGGTSSIIDSKIGNQQPNVNPPVSPCKSKAVTQIMVHLLWYPILGRRLTSLDCTQEPVFRGGM